MTADAPRETLSAPLRLLGSPCLADAVSGETSALSGKFALLLACLALAPQRRAHLAALLWPDRGEEQARSSLRNALSRLRGMGLDLRADADSVLLATESDLTRLARAAQLSVDPESAIALSAPLLEGIEPEGDVAEDWLRAERAHCRILAERVLERAVEGALERGQAARALTAAQRLLNLDPLREQSHRLLMRLHAARGDRAMAMAQFRACRDTLRRELDLAPSPETEALMRSLATPEPPPRDDYRISIAVMAFAHAEDDPDAQFLAAGIAEDITTELSRHRDFLVMARPTSARFANGDALARDLGVRYTVTGDLRRAGHSISISARLVDEAEGRSLWAVRHRGSSADFFVLCEQLVCDLCEQLDAQIREAERERAVVTPPGHLDAWGLYHRGMWHAFRFDAGELDRAEACFDQALALAPDFGLAHAGHAYAAIVRAVMLWDPDAPAILARGLDHARRATAHDPVSPFVSMVHGRLLLMHGETGVGFDLLTSARDRHPSYAHLHYCLALSHHGAGEPDLALQAIDRAIRLSPRDPLMSMFLTVRAGSLFFTDRPVEAEAAARAALGVSRRDVWALTMLAVILAEKGEAVQARALLTGADGAFPDQAGTTIWPLIRLTVAPQAAERVRKALQTIGLSGF